MGFCVGREYKTYSGSSLADSTPWSFAHSSLSRVIVVEVIHNGIIDVFFEIDCGRIKFVLFALRVAY